MRSCPLLGTIGAVPPCGIKGATTECWSKARTFREACETLAALMGIASADVAQLVERVLGKDEVTGSIPVVGSRT